MTDVPLFPLPKSAPIPRAKTLRELDRESRPRWLPYKVKQRLPCDECVMVLHEAHGVGPHPRSARVIRRAGGRDLYLCSAHADEWRKEEGK